MDKLKELIYFIVLLRGQSDGYKDIGIIHIIKYLYLADVIYFTRKRKKYTNVDWTFHNFGPWSVQAYNKAIETIKFFSIDEINISNSRYGEFKRYKAENYEDFRNLEEKIPSFLRHQLEKYIYEFGTDTEELLHYVYKTEPMLNSSPEELIDFEFIKPIEKQSTKKQLGVKNKSIANKAKVLKEKFKNKKTKKIKRVKFKPRYDEVYFEGVKFLEDDLPSDIRKKGTAKLDKAIFKSESRYDPELS